MDWPGRAKTWRRLDGGGARGRKTKNGKGSGAQVRRAGRAGGGEGRRERTGLGGKERVLEEQRALLLRHNASLVVDDDATVPDAAGPAVRAPHDHTHD